MGGIDRRPSAQTDTLVYPPCSQLRHPVFNAHFLKKSIGWLAVLSLLEMAFI